MQEENIWKTVGLIGKEIVKNSDMHSGASYTHTNPQQNNKQTTQKKKKVGKYIMKYNAGLS